MESDSRWDEEACTVVVELGGIAAHFAMVERATQKVDGTKENDAEHSYMLGLVAVHLATVFYPNLDSGLIAKYAVIHDLPELIVGDTPTFGITKERRAAKESAEDLAAKTLVSSLPEPWGDMLQQYEKQEEPEARFVRLVDKMMPALMHIHGNGRATFKDSYGVETEQQFWAIRGERARELRDEYPEFPEMHDLSEKIIQRSVLEMWGNDE